MKPSTKSRLYRPLADETLPSMTAMSTKIADDKLAFRELQRQLKTRGATTSAGIKQTLHSDITVQFNEMSRKGDDDRSFQSQSVQEEGNWSDMLKRRLNLSSMRGMSSQRSLSGDYSSRGSSRGISSKRSFNLATARGLTSQRNLNLQSTRGITSQRSLFDKAPERNVVPTFANDANIYATLDIRAFERRGR